MNLKLSVVIPTFRAVHNLEAVVRPVAAALRAQRPACKISRDRCVGPIPNIPDNRVHDLSGGNPSTPSR